MNLISAGKALKIVLTGYEFINEIKIWFDHQR